MLLRAIHLLDTQRKDTLGLGIFKEHVNLLTRKLIFFPSPSNFSALSYCCLVYKHYIVFIQNVLYSVYIFVQFIYSV